MIILLNGPPECGKDALARYVTDLNPTKFRHDSMKGVMLDLVNGFGIDVNDEQAYREWKSTVVGRFGLTGRQFLIEFSEYFMKPRFGNDVFGRMLVERHKKAEQPHTIVSDCGFEEEARYCVYNVNSVGLLRIKRPGKGFEGDSRNYVYGATIPMLHYEKELYNNSSLGAFLAMGNDLINRWTDSIPTP